MHETVRMKPKPQWRPEDVEIGVRSMEFLPRILQALRSPSPAVENGNIVEVPKLMCQ